LHEPAWRKLAEQLHLSYEPYGKKGDTDDIDLHNQELRFQDCHGLFMGAESDVNYLRRLIDVMCDLAEAIEHVAT
jgi:hypothetical protein